MLKKWLALIVFALLLSACSYHNQATTTPVSSSASWAYPFVRVNGVPYGVSNIDNEVNKSELGKKIGEVKRNVMNMDSGSKQFIEKNFDSNVLTKGTSLFEDIKNKNVILYEKNGKFYQATKVKNSK